MLLRNRVAQNWLNLPAVCHPPVCPLLTLTLSGGFSKISGVIMDKKLSGGVGPVLAMKQSAVQKINQREAERKEQVSDPAPHSAAH